jgi:hypothetical protein
MEDSMIDQMARAEVAEARALELERKLVEAQRRIAETSRIGLHRPDPAPEPGLREAVERECSGLDVWAETMVKPGTCRDSLRGVVTRLRKALATEPGGKGESE